MYEMNHHPHEDTTDRVEQEDLTDWNKVWDDDEPPWYTEPPDAHLDRLEV